jgi:hypothetical protein
LLLQLNLGSGSFTCADPGTGNAAGLSTAAVPGHHHETETEAPGGSRHHEQSQPDTCPMASGCAVSVAASVVPALAALPVVALTAVRPSMQPQSPSLCLEPPPPRSLA